MVVEHIAVISIDHRGSHGYLRVKRTSSEPLSAQSLEESQYVELLAVRALLTALVVAATSVVQARLGPRASGWLIGLPLTSCPYLLLVGLDEGPWVARATAAGIIVGQTTSVACGAAYVHVARRRGWLPATAAGAVVAVVASAVLVLAKAPLWVAVPVLAVLLVCALACWPRYARGHAGGPVEGDGWRRDVVVRTVAATVCVVAASESSGPFGPHVAGALTSFPTVNLILAAFTQRSMGRLATISLVESMLTGTWCGGVFTLTVALTAGPMGTLGACGLALSAAVVAKAVTRPLSRALLELHLAARLRGRVRARVNA
jgi:hypothetical protein